MNRVAKHRDLNPASMGALSEAVLRIDEAGRVIDASQAAEPLLHNQVNKQSGMPVAAPAFVPEKPGGATKSWLTPAQTDTSPPQRAGTARRLGVGLLPARATTTAVTAVVRTRILSCCGP